ncbi:MAG: hypothetical protein SFU25_05560 [Candidatus Caenarcaniphilales bacterium]|nr:hypothetical protein [Candidatus Caenarcaniphilales bacterium]
MYSIYRLNAGELDSRFVESLKALFRGKEIEIIISEVEQQEPEYQETERKKRSVLQAIEEEDVRRFV